MKWQKPYTGKIKKNIINLLTAEFAHRVVKVNAFRVNLFLVKLGKAQLFII